jgi:sigma-B regulation protein RsbU (phosphoserine phosphatase)
MTIEAGTATREQLRLAAVDELELLDTPGEERFDRITRIARELFGVPVVEINLLDENRQFTKSPQIPGQSPNSPRSESFCDVTIQGSDLLVVPDATQDERFAHRTTVTGERHIRFYAGRPLSLHDGLNVGSLCLVDSTPRALNDADRQLLDDLGTWVERELRETAERDRAADIQRRLLPTGRPGSPVWDTAGLSLPISHVGGDFYAWHETPTGMDVTIADVMGKGAGAALLGAGIRSAFQARIGGDPARAVAAANAQLAIDFDATGTFATLFHARLDFASGTVDYADAGHGLTIVVRSDGAVERLHATGLPLGFASEGTWQTGSTTIEAGDVLVSFTDGVLDLFDGTLASLDPLGRLILDAGSAEDIADRVRALAHGIATDDVTLVAISRQS